MVIERSGITTFGLNWACIWVSENYINIWTLEIRFNEFRNIGYSDADDRHYAMGVPKSWYPISNEPIYR